VTCGLERVSKVQCPGGRDGPAYGRRSWGQAAGQPAFLASVLGRDSNVVRAALPVAPLIGPDQSLAIDQKGTARVAVAMTS